MTLEVNTRMASDSAAAIPTGMGISGQVAISVRDDATSHSSAIANLQFYNYVVVLFLTVQPFMGLLIPVRIGIMFQNENKPSPFGNNGLFIIMSVVALFVNLPVTVCLICTNYYFQISWMRKLHFTILKCIGYFSALLAPSSLMMVIFIPHSLNWIGFLLVCVIFGIAVALCYSDDHQKNESGKFIINYTALLLVPISLVLVIFIPNNLNWIVNSTVFLFFVIEFVYIFIKQSIQHGSSSNDPARQ